MNQSPDRREFIKPVAAWGGLAPGEFSAFGKPVASVSSRLKGYGLTFLILLALACAVRAGETLYNGIQLPEEWPPVRPALTREPMPVPYLKNPPAVIPVNESTS